LKFSVFGGIPKVIYNEGGANMNLKRLLLVCLVLGVLLLATSVGRTQTKSGNPPVITHSFAVEKGYYGYIWKIYIEADDPDGDMLRIASVVDQAGYGHYPTDTIYLKPQYQKHLKGYLQWNTFSSRTSYLEEWTQITLKVSVIDKAGNESNEVVFPFTFESGVKDQYRYELSAPFTEKEIPKIGSITIDLVDYKQGNGARDN
jgi:hypothetical protein